jgi:hypothetical protein
MRPRLLALLTLSGLMLSACGSDDSDSSYDPNAGVPSCAESKCVAEVDELARRIAELPGVATVQELRYVPDQITDGPHVGGEIRIPRSERRTQCDSLEDRLAQLVWESEVAPVDGMRVACRVGNSDAGRTLGLSWTLDPLTYRDKWGPRTTH